MTQEILIPDFVHLQGTCNWKPKLSFKNWENQFSNAWNIIAPLSHAIDLLSSGQLGFNLRGYVALWWFEEQPVQQSKPPSLVTHENQIIISCTGLLCCAKLLLWLSVALTTLSSETPLSEDCRHCCPLNCFQVWKWFHHECFLMCWFGLFKPSFNPIWIWVIPVGGNSWGTYKPASRLASSQKEPMHVHSMELSSTQCFKEAIVMSPSLHESSASYEIWLPFAAGSLICQHSTICIHEINGPTLQIRYKTKRLHPQTWFS